MATEDMGRLARLTVLAAAIASVANLAGGIIFSSRLLILNGLTCVANLVTAIAGLWFYRETLKPPDADHPLGHAGYSFSSAVFTLVVYAFIMGLGVDEVANPTPYRVAGYAWTVPAGVLALYTLSVLVARRVGRGLEVYANLTTSEIAESVIALALTPLAHEYSYMIDRAGAASLLAYLAYQVAVNTRDVLRKLSLPSPPPEVVEGLKRDFELMGVKVKDLRLRTIAGSQVSGYAVISVPSEESVEEAHAIADRLERVAKSKYNVDLVVHIEPEMRSNA